MSRVFIDGGAINGDPLEVEPFPPDLVDLVQQFKSGGNFTAWKWVRDYKLHPNTLKLYSKPHVDSTLKNFLVHGEVDVTKEKMIELIVQMTQRSKWDETYVEHQILHKSTKGTDIMFSVSKYPFPLAKRTYVIKRSLYGSMDDVVVLVSKVIPYEYTTKYKWSTKVDDFESILMVRNHKPGEEACEMLATYFENPKVILPNMYLNQIIETLVPRILEKLVIASKKFGTDQSPIYCRGLYLTPLDSTGQSTGGGPHHSDDAQEDTNES
ncbi:START domain family protein [Babesia bovis T2Bo]|uniref:START domain-containing protein n=1 Tax=Babesia bovis TaxID=5865 RepID=A7ATQ5_BABBO|nr:START domain family protein [Babesia bovis T2Bo]EDO06316.1 START domain family protein [Babesia bovis T2Bo]|eukprot:XP_001609884.1 hypothetical protein [Babesia bovis T2Bo]